MLFLPNLIIKTLQDCLAQPIWIHIITLEGSHGVGKDVYARALQALAFQQHQDCSIIRFADPLRALFCQTLNITPRALDVLKRQTCLLLDTPNVKIEGIDVQGCTCRQALVRVAETLKQRHGPYYFANQLIQTVSYKIQSFVHQNQIDLVNRKLFICIPDLRFAEELKALQALMTESPHGIHMTHIQVGPSDPNTPSLVQPDFTVPAIQALECLNDFSTGV